MLDFIKVKNHQESEKTTTEWEKLFANHISDERLVVRIYKRTLTTQ